MNTPIIKEKGGEPLSRLVQILVSLSAPERIYLLSDKNSQEPPYSFLLVLAERNVHQHNKHRENLEKVTHDLPGVWVVFLNAEDFEEVLTQGHIYLSRFCNPDSLLYDTGSLSTPALPGWPIKEVVSNAEEQFMSIFKKADGFLQAARYLYMQNENELSAFLLHQTVEQTYRSLVVTYLNQLEISHDLQALRRYSAVISRDMDEVWNSSQNSIKEPLALLQEAYLEARYNPGFIVEDADLETLIEIVRILQEATRRVWASNVRKFERHFGIQ